MDFTDMTNEQLYELIEDAQTELGRRQTTTVFEQKIGALLDEGQASGVIVQHEDGTPWEPVTGYHNVYSKGAVHTHNGKTWTSNIDFNAQEPGLSGWTEQPTEDDEGNIEYPVITAPAGYEDVKAKGFIGWWPDKSGALYESLIDDNQWTPESAPQHWEEMN